MKEHDLRGKKVMVTGGAGFIGSTLVRELIKEGAKITVFDIFSSGDMRNLKGIEDKINVIKGDITGKNFRSILEKSGAEFVFNLAAEPYIPHCYNRPLRFFEVNANGAINVLFACKHAGVKRVVQYSTSEVYGSAKYVPMDEDHPTLPLSTYAVSKLAADRLCYTFYHEQKIPVVILRQFNVYGPRETQPYIIPEIITQLSQSNRLKLGNISARRDLTYVEDAAKGAIALMKARGTDGQVFNMGTGKDWSVKQMAETIGRLMGHKKIKIEIDKARLRPLDVSVLRCDPSKMRKLTGWKAAISFEEGLKRTIEDFEDHGRAWLWEKKISPEKDVWTDKKDAHRKVELDDQ
jgi:nucleoside-diphosphate-sugar epimerase